MNEASTQPDLSTKAAQCRHYKDIHARVMTSRTMLAVCHDAIEAVTEYADPEPEDISPSPEIESGPLTIKLIQRVVAKHCGVSRDDIMSKSRFTTVVLPRHIAMYFAKKVTRHSFLEIGRRFGGRDHTTARHAYWKIDELRQHDFEIASDLATIEARLSDLTKAFIG